MKLMNALLRPILLMQRSKRRAPQWLLLHHHLPPPKACSPSPAGQLSGACKQNFYWGHKEVLIPVYKSMADATAAFPEVNVMVSFASLRSAYDSTIECLEFPQIRTIA